MAEYLCEEDMNTGEYISRDETLKIFHQCCDNCTSSYNGVMCRACADAGAMDILVDIPAADVQPVVDTKNMATVSDEFVCEKCGIYLKDYIKVVMDEDNDGYIDEQHYAYEPKFCPECGAKVESCIKTPKRDKPLYTMDEICKMNGVEFSPRKDGDTE